MRIKPGARVRGLVTEILVGLMVAESIYQKFAAEAVITSGTEHNGGHMRGSAHWTGRAVDLRVKNVSPPDRGNLTALLSDALGYEYDVVHEGVGKAWEHIHMEYDPKEGA